MNICIYGWPIASGKLVTCGVKSSGGTHTTFAWCSKKCALPGLLGVVIQDRVTCASAVYVYTPILLLYPFFQNFS